MKKYLLIMLTLTSIFFSCSKNDDGDDDNNGGGGGGGNNNDGLTGRYIMKTAPLCPEGSSYFVGYSLAGNLVDHYLGMTVSDTLNSWYLQKLSTGKYLIYAKKGNSFLVWRRGFLQTFLIIYQQHLIELPQFSSLPQTNIPPEMQFDIKIANVTEATIISDNNYYVTTFKGGKKTATGAGCSYTGSPALLQLTECIERDENGSNFQYCFQRQVYLQKIN